MQIISRWLKSLGKETQSPDLAELQAKSPFELIECSAFDVPKQLETLRAAGTRLGFSPVILGDMECTTACVERLATSKTNVLEIITTASTIDVVGWLEERRRQEEYDIDEVLGDWPKNAPPNNKLLMHTLLTNDFKKKPLSPFYIAKIPTVNSWEIPAYLQFGDWNSCPAPEYQVALARYWQKAYHAHIVSMAGDIVEYSVEKPPSNKTSAEKLAREQFTYSPDIVLQGVETIRTLAAVLLNSHYWFFWWD